MKLNKITPTGKPSEIIVSDEIFAVAINQTLIAQAIRVYLSNQRQGTSKVKNRSAVARTKAKWYKQKGTGKARHGSRNAPIFVGGGVAHGPKGLENWDLKLSTKQKLAALKSALSLQLANTMVSDIPLETEGKTKYAKRFIDLICKTPEDKVLVIFSSPTETKIARAFNNLPKVVIQSAQSLTTYQVAGADKITFTTQGLDVLTKRLLKSEKADTVKTIKIKPKKLKEAIAPVKKSVPEKTVKAKKITKKIVSAKATTVSKSVKSAKKTKSVALKKTEK